MCAICRMVCCFLSFLAALLCFVSDVLVFSVVVAAGWRLEAVAVGHEAGPFLVLYACQGVFGKTNGKRTPHGDDCDDDVFIVL